uniref:Uncharacterized protein n=1 Tax=Cacopsylla melanoneura TaxID=428564 RepID=A0A8D9EB89_9HEMI
MQNLAHLNVDYDLLDYIKEEKKKNLIIQKLYCGYKQFILHEIDRFAPDTKLLDWLNIRSQYENLLLFTSEPRKLYPLSGTEIRHYTAAVHFFHPICISAQK